MTLLRTLARTWGDRGHHVRHRDEGDTPETLEVRLPAPDGSPGRTFALVDSPMNAEGLDAGVLVEVNAVLDLRIELDDPRRHELVDFVMMLNNRLVLGAFGLRGDAGLYYRHVDLVPHDPALWGEHCLELLRLAAFQLEHFEQILTMVVEGQLPISVAIGLFEGHEE